MPMPIRPYLLIPIHLHQDRYNCGVRWIAEGEMSNEIGQRITSRKLGRDNGNTWRLTLLFQVKQSLLFNVQCVPGSGDFGIKWNFHLICRCQSSLSFEFWDLPLQLSDLPFDFFPRSHCWLLPNFHRFVRFLSPGTWNLAPQMLRECSKNNSLSCYPKWNGTTMIRNRLQVPSRKLNREKFAKVVIFFRGLIYSHFWKF